ncbi:MAG: MFS transporter [Alphaproteobacteria bacterium]|jgi:MFS family permease|nr:MFS transporter [Alphaproteobacteria bacterium]
MATTSDSAPSLDPATRRITLAAVIACISVFGLTYGLTAPLIALLMARQGASDALIGVNSAMHAVGILATTFSLPALAARFGPRRLILSALALAIVTLALIAALPNIWIWFPLRIVLGAAVNALFVLSETWINQVADDATRGRTMAIYTSSLSLGFAIGPTILSMSGIDGWLPFLIAMALIAAAGLTMWPSRVVEPQLGAGGHKVRWRYMALAPIAMAIMVLNACLDSAVLSMLPLYAIQHGWSEARAPLLVTAFLVGSIVLQYPIGWAADRLGRRRVMLVCSVAATILVAGHPLVIGHPTAAMVLEFAWGGLFVGIYTIMLAVVGARFQGGRLVAVYALLSLMWGVGALLGPLTAGAAMQALPPHGLAIYMAAASLGFTVFLWQSRSAA